MFASNLVYYIFFLFVFLHLSVVACRLSSVGVDCRTYLPMAVVSCWMSVVGCQVLTVCCLVLLSVFGVGSGLSEVGCCLSGIGC